MSLLQSTVAGLRARDSHLKVDFESWRSLTSPTGQFGQHNSQVERITKTLSATLEVSLSAAQLNNVTLGQLPDLRRAIGSIHLLWEFFRDKLAQRAITTFENHLGAADDLAWSCYKLFLEAAVAAGTVERGSVKEPPLVFYSTDRSPYAQARTKTFHPPGMDSRDVKVFSEVLKNLPVPVIGMPWPVANCLPELVFVGHEVGHVVAEDLGLADEAEQAVASLSYAHDVGDVRRTVWQKWSDEVFGDVFGICATGRAFADVLAAEFAAAVDDVRFVRIDKQRPGHYPTPTLRMAICEALLRGLGVTPSTAWSEMYGDLIGDSREFKDDVEPVADALLNRPWDALGGKKLGDLMPWGPEDEEQAASIGRSLLAETSPAVPFKVRTSVAAAVKALQLDAPAYARLGLDAKFADFIVNRRGDGLRSEDSLLLRRGPISRSPGSRAAAMARLEAADQETGRDIARILKLTF